MTRFLLWLFGVKTLPSAHAEKVSLDFVFLPSAYVLPVFVAALLAALTLGAWVYRKRRDKLNRRRWVMLALRVAAAMLLSFLLAGPLLEVKGLSSVKSTVVVLVDNSRSMSLVDAKDEEEALRRAGIAMRRKELATGDAPISADLERELAEASRRDIMRAVVGDSRRGLLKTLLGDYNLKLYSFGAAVRGANPELARYDSWLDALRADEPETRLGSALETALTDQRGVPVAAVVVLSDGSPNGGADVEGACELAGRRGVPVYFIGIGDPDVRDVQVSYVDMRDVVFVDDQAAVNVRLRHWGCGGQPVALAVLGPEGELSRTEVTLNESGEQSETIRFVPRKRGRFTFSVRAEPLDGELVVENNEKSKEARVVDQKIRVLWVESAPRWEYRYAKNLISRDDKRFEGAILLYDSDPEVRTEDGFYLKSFPANEDDLAGYHIIVLGDMQANRLTLSQMSSIRNYVANRGGSVLFMPGHRFGPATWKGTQLEELLPVVPAESAPTRRSAMDDINRPVTQGVRARITGAGNDHPYLYISDDRKETREAWQKHLVVYSQHEIERAKPGAKVLLETAGDSPVPLVASLVYGSGTVLYMGTDDLWRWRYRPGPLTHDRFWGSLLQQIALSSLLGESRFVSLSLSREELAPGETQLVRARLLAGSENELSVDTLRVSVTVHGEGTEKDRNEELLLRSDAQGSGSFSGKYVPAETGAYTLSLSYREEKAVAGFRVAERLVEFDNPALNKRGMAAWAKLSGGNVYDPWALEALPDEIVVKAKQAHVHTLDELWDAPLWAFLFAGLAGVEWFLRKWSNLP